MLAALPREAANQARTAYDLFRSNPRHPSLHFKRAFANDPLVSVRVGRDLPRCRRGARNWRDFVVLDRSA